MIQPRDCSNCGRPAEAPFIIAQFGVSAESERVFCRDCLDQLHKLEEAEKLLEEEIRSGSICYLCYEELNPPGGTTISLGGLVRRLCPSCKDGIEPVRLPERACPSQICFGTFRKLSWTIKRPVEDVAPCGYFSYPAGELENAIL